MSQEFNPLRSKVLFTPPARLHPQSARNEHVPFVLLLVVPPVPEHPFKQTWLWRGLRRAKYAIIKR